MKWYEMNLEEGGRIELDDFGKFVAIRAVVVMNGLRRERGEYFWC